MKHRILAAMICVCLALTSLCIPALADDTEAETPVPVEATPAPAEATPAPVEATPAPIVEESEEQPLEAAAVPAVQGTQSILRINDVNIDENTYYKSDLAAPTGYSEATEEDYNFYYDARSRTLVLRNAVLTRTKPASTILYAYTMVGIPITIELIGENRLTVPDGNSVPINIGDVIIKGSGSLTLVGGITYITKLTMDSGTFITDDLRPVSGSVSERGLYFNGGCFTANTHFGGQMELYIGAEFYRWKTDLSRDYMPSIFETCPYPGGMPLSLVQMDDPFRSKLRVNPATNEWEVSYDSGTTWKSLGVKATGEDGKDGTDGLTPTIGENGNWWIGDTDTGVKAAAADGRDGADGKDGVDGKDGANGKDGIDGKDGVDGKDGTDGAQGAPGLTPSIGGNGNWWLGNTDTGVRAAGTTGATGAAGATGATGATGAAGRNGTDGKDGKDGKDGVGIREVSLNDSGELIVALTDGTETNLGKITGEDGAPGVGISSVQVGENGMLTVTLSNGESVEAGAVFSAQEGKTVRTVSYITAAAAALAFLWLAVLTTLFAKSRRTAVHR